MHTCTDEQIVERRDDAFLRRFGVDLSNQLFLFAGYRMAGSMAG